MEKNVNEIRVEARQKTIEILMPALMENDAIKFADGSFAILQDIDGQEVWTEITVKSKAWKDTKRSKAFDPLKIAQEWEEEKKIKAGVKKA